MSQFHDHYEQVEVIADCYKGIFEAKLIALYPHDASKRLRCEDWAFWPRHTFIEHLKLIYPQITNITDKTFLAMIKDFKFEFDLDNSAYALLTTICNYNLTNTRKPSLLVHKALASIM